VIIYIDADGCAVKEEVYRVAERYELRVILVANKAMNIQQNNRVSLVVVPAGLDVADDWIAERVISNDIVITADIPLADRCVKKGAKVLGPKGIEFTEDSVGEAMATRELMKNLREVGEVRGGPAPMEKKDRSRFLGKLDQIVQAIIRSGRS
jgi:uncharacterized protein YaiI (UPF0178 family)